MRKAKSLQTMRNTIKEKSSLTIASSSGQNIQTHLGQSHGDITSTIRPRDEANVGPTKAVQPPARSIHQPRAPQPGASRHWRVPTATGLVVVAQTTLLLWFFLLLVKHRAPVDSIYAATYQFIRCKLIRNIE